MTAERKPSPRPRHSAADEAGYDEPEQDVQGVESVTLDPRELDDVEPATATPDAVTHADVPAGEGDEPERHGSEVGGTCNVPGCPDDGVTRGLCEAHWCTHRGLADPLAVDED